MRSIRWPATPPRYRRGRCIPAGILSTTRPVPGMEYEARSWAWEEEGPLGPGRMSNSPLRRTDRQVHHSSQGRLIRGPSSTRRVVCLAGDRGDFVSVVVGLGHCLSGRRDTADCRHEALPNATPEELACFLGASIVFRFGIPERRRQHSLAGPNVPREFRRR